MKFSIEHSVAPIYGRISHCLARSLIAHGHQASIDDPQEWESLDHYLHSLEERRIDVSLITNLSGIKTSFLPTQSQFFFELLPHQIVFLHHDHYATCPTGATVEQLLKAYQKVSSRSHHFCIESSDCGALRELGLNHVHFIHHATEFNMPPSPVGTDARVSFVGHVLEPTAESQPTHHWLLRDYWSRVCDLTHQVQPTAVQYSRQSSRLQDPVSLLAAQTDYLSALHRKSLFMRGDVLKRVGSHPLHVYGGDPAYLHGIDLHRELQAEHLFYHPPRHQPSETAAIYNQSVVSINITPFQFDTAVINRVLDIGAAGGLPLTDWKEDLAGVTSVHAEISYRSPEELAYKIRYYSHPDHQQERLDLCHCLSAEIQAKYSYEQVTADLLAQLQGDPQVEPLMAVPDAETALVKVDLGCGSHKPPGFIGVDRYASPVVDTVADLTKRFPFETNSVDAVRAHDIIEHLPDRIHTMNEIWRICKDKACVDIRVPSTDGRGAFQDPTHVSFWNANSFQYYCPQYPAYHQLCQTYGFKGAFALLSLEEEISADQVVHLQVQLQVVKSVPDPEALSTLLAELRPVNLLLEATPFTDQSYACLKTLVGSLLKVKNSGEIALFVAAGDLSGEGQAEMLTQLMLELLLEGWVDQQSKPPHIAPAPADPLLLGQLLPRLAFRGPLEESSVQDVLAGIQSAQD